MKRFKVQSLARVAAVAALPIALAFASAPAGAQWSSQQQQQPQRGSRYPQQVNGNYNNGSQELFEWSGRVDKEIRIEMSGSRAAVMQVGNNERGTGRARAMAAIPRGDGNVTVQVLEGRGRVDVVQQPRSQNGYTAIVRVRDPDAGQGTYRIAAYWQGIGNNNGYYGRDRRGGGEYGRGRP